MYQGHEDYNPNNIGAITQAKVLAALVEAGWVVMLPYMSITRFDLMIMDTQGRVYRVQCKTGQMFHGAIGFRPFSLRAAKKETGWHRIVSNYQGEIEYFGVYCPENGKVYLVPIEDAPNRSICMLRVDPPKNNQRKRIRWAKDYEVTPKFLQAQLESN
jgi:hypothetical protein